MTRPCPALPWPAARRPGDCGTRPRRRLCRVGPERGAATAELAVVLPILLAVTTGLVWLLSVGLAQVRTVDAAREVARAVARGDDPGSAVARGEQVAPEGARFSVSSAAGMVTVRVTGNIEGPGGLFARLPGAKVQAEATALLEEP